MSAIGTTPLVVRELQLNYLWPQYSLPWNNFYGRVQPNPFYLQNQLRNITIREVQSPVNFRSMPIVSSGDGVGRELTVPNWAEIKPRRSTEQTSTAVKVFVGPYADIAKDITGLEYQYDFLGKVLLSEDDIDEFVYLSLNLNNNNPSTINFPAYVQTHHGRREDRRRDDDDDGRDNTCYVGDRADNFSTLTGTIILNGKDSSCPKFLARTLCLDNAVPIGPCSARCRPETLARANAFYYINGNRLLIAARVPKLDEKSDSDEDCGSHGSDKKRFEKNHINYQVTVRIVETTTPLHKALAVLDLPFAPIV